MEPHEKAEYLLFLACKRRDIDLLRSALTNKPKIKLENVYACLENLDCIIALLENTYQPIDVNAIYYAKGTNPIYGCLHFISYRNHTFLMNAIRIGNPYVVQYLLQKGADPYCVWMQPPLMNYIETPEVLKVFIDYGVVLNNDTITKFQNIRSKMYRLSRLRTMKCHKLIGRYLEERGLDIEQEVKNTSTEKEEIEKKIEMIENTEKDKKTERTILNLKKLINNLEDIQINSREENDGSEILKGLIK